MISVQIHLDDLQERIETIERILNETHPASGVPSPISREVRGLSVVLLFAAYEHLLHSLTRTLLEGAVQVRVGNRRLQPGFRAFALEGAAKAARNMSEKRLFSAALPKLVDVANPPGRVCTIDTSSFPTDGSFMKRSQIQVWCSLFGIPHPQKLLHRTWQSIDTVVSERNGIAHGRLTPEAVGRGYTEVDIRKLVDDWHLDWKDFLNDVGTRASTRDFFRIP